MDKTRAQQVLKDAVPSPLKFSRAGEKSSEPYMVEVTNGQWDRDPKKKTLVIHIHVRPGINQERAKEVFQHALVDVFGAKPDNDFYMDFFDPAEFQIRYGTQPALTQFTMNVIFSPGPIVDTRRPEFVRDAMAQAMAKWHGASASW